MVKYTCYRCLKRKPSARCHVNNFDELLCEDCEPNAWWDPIQGRSITWAEVRQRELSEQQLARLHHGRPR